MDCVSAQISFESRNTCFLVYVHEALVSCLSQLCKSLDIKLLVLFSRLGNAFVDVDRNFKICLTLNLLLKIIAYD